ncbi:YqgE/AlgH family protein [Roseomonas rosulenta]|uniref:YqgE/AlgH family protein n=1 Tax=Roseomonas rosulenta TaxID=2748667 RepID=UPI0018DFAD9E|nr:YqgE/AlgH family protein [Roseomonas rosulenta]
MAKTTRSVPEPTEGYLAGHLLIAMPGMQDPRFDHSVVCLCAHSSEGAMGLMVNRPLAGMVFDDLLQQLKVEPLPPQRRIRMVSGGPAETGRGFVLHTDDWTTEGSLTFAPGLTLTASTDILAAIAGGGGPRDGVLALGYAGWGPGQLEDEIQRNAWLNVPAEEALVFRDDLTRSWDAALARLRIDPALLSGTAGRA